MGTGKEPVEPRDEQRRTFAKERPVDTQKRVWEEPTYEVTATGFEVTMYLGTQADPQE